MLLNCPHCATIYSIDAVVIGDNGRSLRCARCKTVWFATRSQELVFATAPTAVIATSDPAPSVSSYPSTPSTSPPSAVERTITNTVPEESAPSLAPAAAGSTHADDPAAASAQAEDIETFARRRAREADNRVSRLRAQFGLPTVIAMLAVIVALLVAWRIPIVQHAPQLASFYTSIGLPVNLRGLVFHDVRTSHETRDGVPVLVVEGTIVSIARAPVEVPRLRFALRDDAGQEIYSWLAPPEASILQPGASLPFRSRLATPPSAGKDLIIRFVNKRDAIEGAR